MVDCVLLAIGGGPKQGGGQADIAMIVTADSRYLATDSRDDAASRS